MEYFGVGGIFGRPEIKIAVAIFMSEYANSNNRWLTTSEAIIVVNRVTVYTTIRNHNEQHVGSSAMLAV